MLIKEEPCIQVSVDFPKHILVIGPTDSNNSFANSVRLSNVTSSLRWVIGLPVPLRQFNQNRYKVNRQLNDLEIEK